MESKKDYVYIGFGNYWDDERDECKKIFDALESGKRVKTGCSCIGHTRAQMEENRAYVSLTTKYGERLVCEDDDWGDTIYSLKEV